MYFTFQHTINWCMTNFTLVIRHIIIHNVLLRLICLNSSHGPFLVSIFLILFPLQVVLLNLLPLVLFLPVILKFSKFIIKNSP
jgi:hypothetical protein